ncbi:MAG: DUF2752 domain-containing protein [Acidimicrobiia bacterium]|nr:DUF2752 domain-containing protein [Acidimicrobiia bacterium]
MSVTTAVASSLPPPPAAMLPGADTASSTRWYTDLRLVGPVGLAAGLALWSPTDDGVTICPWRNCTGGACPGCGLTRGAAAFFKGDVATSWYYHPAALFIIVQVAALWGLAVGRRAGVVSWRLSPRAITLLFWINGLALLALWLVRWRFGHLERVL